MTQRTNTQSKALHLHFEHIAQALNDAGISKKQVIDKFKDGVMLEWDAHGVKNDLWRPLQQALLRKKSTTELEKIGEIEQVDDYLMRWLGETFGVEQVPFPFDPEKVSNYPDGRKIV